ncbi:4'-phosphopantetheinyl transferase superfamily [Suillus clintonianus]|uniref:4'-phosphopantetheinyl transferase superfamily n=1 Tax=Suillus clintonianus TaxID=1904413 RepID=UPI001B882BC2|nr:4'-phosphopantetheinyl transferase superfamily [Suillus clintonianus]KAG2146766.1 4'-phosphopantetheinyl transferase superfamily [Suillus clintonianus]
MPILGIGVDILHLPRLISLLNRRRSEAFATRILSSQELRTFQLLAGQHGEDKTEKTVRFLGVRWAVKEAAYKALYPIRPTWKEISYSSFNGATGAKPTLVYHPVRDDVGPANKLHVSVSHDGDYIYAQVIAEST